MLNSGSLPPADFFTEAAQRFLEFADSDINDDEQPLFLTFDRPRARVMAVNLVRASGELGRLQQLVAELTLFKTEAEWQRTENPTPTFDEWGKQTS